MMLATRDAHGLCESFGLKQLAAPERFSVELHSANAHVQVPPGAV